MENTRKPKKSNIPLTVVIIAVIAILAIIASVITLSVLGSGNESRKEYTAYYLASEVAKKMNYENLSEISPENISKYYEIPDNVVSDSAMFVSNRSDSFTEVACFKLKSRVKEDVLSDSISEYLSAKAKTYQNVNEKAYNTVSASKTDVHYPYVFVAVSSDSEAAISTFETLVKSADQQASEVSAAG